MATSTTVSTAAIQDVKIAYDLGKDLGQRIDHSWVYNVDPETMEEVRALWRLMDGSKSLYNAFCSVLRMA